jgi:PTS system nitrogen regulatory IIA component
MKMADLFTIERVIPWLRARDKRDALRKLAARATNAAQVPAAAIAHAVPECAELPVIGPGAGVSLVHAFVPGLGDPIAIFARLEPAVDFGAVDGSQTDLVALLLSPAMRTGNHLRALACIARTLRDPHVHDLLRAARSGEALYVILCRRDEHHFSREPALAESGLPSQLKYR